MNEEQREPQAASNDTEAELISGLSNILKSGIELCEDGQHMPDFNMGDMSSYTPDQLTVLRQLNGVLRAATGLQDPAELLAQMQQMTEEMQGNPAVFQERVREAIDFMNNSPELAALTGAVPPDMDATTYVQGVKDALSIVAKLSEIDVASAVANLKPALTGEKFNINTSQEFDLLSRAVSDGRNSDKWQNDEVKGLRSYICNDLPHKLSIEILAKEREAGLGLDVLTHLTGELDADGILALLYISTTLEISDETQNYVGGWICLDDVIDKIGWSPRSTEERQEMRRKVYGYMCFGARAKISGNRTTTYKDPATGKEIQTRIDHPLWFFLEEEKPIQPALFADVDIPIRQEILLSRPWRMLLINPNTKQFFPMGELLGGIPGNKASGAWARVIGLALASFWRRHPQRTIDRSLCPSRRELLTHFLPKVSPPLEVLQSSNPKRAVEYWQQALRILVDSGFLANEGEAARSMEEMRAGISRKGWQTKWLDEAVMLLPGVKAQNFVVNFARRLPAETPRQIPAKNRGGRPRKQKG